MFESAIDKVLDPEDEEDLTKSEVNISEEDLQKAFLKSQ